jgi:O-antigen/teichoic acid export membrane protein
MSANRNNLLLNFVSLGSAKIITGLIFGVLTIYLTRVLQAEALGKYEFAITVFALFNVFAVFGTNKIGVRNIASVKDSFGIESLSGLNSLMGFRLTTSVLAYLLLFVCTLFIPVFARIKELILLSSLSILLIPITFEWFFIGTERMHQVLIKRVLHASCYIIFVLLWVHKPEDVMFVAWGQFGAVVVSLLYLLGMFIKTAGIPRPTFDFQAWKSFFFESYPVALAGVMGQVYLKIDVILLAHFKTDADVGFYTAAYRIVLFLLGIRAMGLDVIFPTMSRYLSQSSHKLSELISSVQKIAISVGIPAGVAGTVLAKPIIELAFGKGYLPSVPVFIILIWSVTIQSLNFTYPQLQIAANRSKTYMMIINAVGLLNFILNLLLIPSFGMLGAAVATVAVDLLSLILFFSASKKIVHSDLARLLSMPVLASVIMGIVLYYLLFLPVLLNFAIGFSLYVIILIGAGYLHKKDLSFLFAKQTNEQEE